MSLKKGNRSQLELRVQFNSAKQKKNEESLPTFESDVQKFDSKQNGSPFTDGSRQITNILSDHDYAEKLHSFVSLASGHEFKDLKVLNKLAEYNEHAKTELDNLKGGHFASDALNQTQFKAPKSTFSQNFESYSRVQRLVDKVIKDTVYALEKDLNVLPEKQQANNVIDRLSSLHLSKLQLQKQQQEQEQADNNPHPSCSTVKLPRILNKLTAKALSAQNMKKRIIDLDDHTTESFFEKSSADIDRSSFQPKALAGFYLKEKRQKPKVNREKDELRKKCLDNFFNSHGKVKDISENYLFNLTQYNIHNGVDPLDTQDTDNTENPPIVTSSKPVLPKLKNQRKGYCSPKTIPSRIKFDNSISGSMIDMSHSNNIQHLVSPKNINKSSFADKNLKTVNNHYEVDVSKDLLFGEDDSLERALVNKEQMIFEGMGLLTLQTQNKMVPKNLTKFSLDTFSLSVKNLRKSDYDYIEAKTGVNLGHQLYDKKISEDDVMRFNADDLQKMF